MSDVIASALDKIPLIKTPSIEDYVQCDKETRILTSELIKKISMGTFINIAQFITGLAY